MKLQFTLQWPSVLYFCSISTNCIQRRSWQVNLNLGLFLELFSWKKGCCDVFQQKYWHIHCWQWPCIFHRAVVSQRRGFPHQVCKWYVWVSEQFNFGNSHWNELRRKWTFWWLSCWFLRQITLWDWAECTKENLFLLRFSKVCF